MSALTKLTINNTSYYLWTTLALDIFTRCQYTNRPADKWMLYHLADQLSPATTANPHQSNISLSIISNLLPLQLLLLFEIVYTSKGCFLTLTSKNLTYVSLCMLNHFVPIYLFNKATTSLKKLSRNTLQQHKIDHTNLYIFFSNSLYFAMISNLTAKHFYK